MPEIGRNWTGGTGIGPLLEFNDFLQIVDLHRPRALAIATLYFGRQIFIPLALALVLSFLLTPLVGLLERARLGRVPAVLVVLIFCFALTAGVSVGGRRPTAGHHGPHSRLQKQS